MNISLQKVTTTLDVIKSADVMKVDVTKWKDKSLMFYWHCQKEQVKKSYSLTAISPKMNWTGFCLLFFSFIVETQSMV